METLPIESSTVDWTACSSQTGNFSHIFFNFMATGDSSDVSTGKKGFMKIQLRFVEASDNLILIIPQQANTFHGQFN